MLLLTCIIELGVAGMYKCHSCSFSTSSLKCYVSHYRIHSHVSNFRFPCGLANCSRTFVSYSAFNSHCTRDHNEFRKRLSEARFRNANVSLQCDSDFCGRQFRDLKAFLNHVKQHINVNRPTPCPYKDCRAHFCKVSTYTSHLSRKHRNYNYDMLRSKLIVGDCQNEPDEAVDTPSTSSELEYGDVVSDKICQSETLQEQYVRSLALFLIKLQSKHLLPAATVQQIVDEIALLHDLGKEYMIGQIKFVLGQYDVATNNIEKIAEELLHLSAHSHANSILHTDHLRKKYFQQHFSYITPESVYLGLDEVNKAAYAYYVPVKDTLMELLQDTSIVFQVLNPNSNLPTVLQDYSDAELCRKNSFLQSNPKCIKLIIFQDAFEVVNPLGSAKSKHKLVGVYMTLANLYPQSRSKISHIQLVQLVKEKSMKKFGANKVFARLIMDLKQLEETGLQVPGHGCFKVILIAVVGDNLGSHFIGGFCENFSTGEYFCRFCDITRSQFQNSCLSIGNERSTSSYAADLQCVVDSNGSMDSHHGIKRSSPFNVLAHYHVAMPGLPPCLGHDLFEGVVDYDLAVALKYFIKEKKWFTYQQLNRTIVKFRCKGCDATHKPSTVGDKGHKLGGHAVQNWTLIRLLPVLIGNRIPNKDDRVWQMCLMLREVVEIVCAPCLSISQISYMQVVIEEYIEMRQELFQSVRLRPKHHYLLHYARLSQQFGPLIRMWSLRFESKHSYFKRVARHSQNFKNVTKTLAERHQLYQAFISTGERFAASIECDHPLPFTPGIYNEQIQEVIAKHECLKQSSVFVAQHAAIDGVLYKTDLYVLIRETESGLVTGRIILILIHENSIFLVIEQHLFCFDSNFGVFISTNVYNHTVDCISVASLLDYLPLPVYLMNGLSVLPLKHKYLRLLD